MGHFENIIVGAGPAGLQCAYYFKKYNIPYLVLERADKAGSFFEKYPHSGSLISINKTKLKSDNADFRLRHDWNSLLNDEGLLFTKYSEDFYPKKENLVCYLNDFAQHYYLNIEYGKWVERVTNEDGQYQIKIRGEKDLYTCSRLIVAVGVSKPNIPKLILNVQDPILHYAQYPAGYFLNKSNIKEFEGKNVFILGGGNAAYELANLLNEVTNSILVGGRSKKKWSMSSHYAGDIRSIYLPFMDTFLLKSLNGTDIYEELSATKNPQIISNLKIEQVGKKYYIYSVLFDSMEPMYPQRPYYDKVIFCTGWTPDLAWLDFSVPFENNGLPIIKPNFESATNPGLFFIGALGQTLDYKKSSGAFIHGFRYLIKTFMHLNYKISFESLKFSFSPTMCAEISNHVVGRWNTSSDMYQMFGYLSDVLFFNLADGGTIYYQNIPAQIVLSHLKIAQSKLKESSLLFIFTLEYGDNIVTNYLEIGDNTSKLGKESNSALIHPVVRVYRTSTKKLVDVVHFGEDLFAEFVLPKLYQEKLERLLKSWQSIPP